MARLLILFIPVLMLVVLANLGQLYLWARRLTYGILLALSAAVLAAGVAALLYHGPLPAAPLPAGLKLNLRDLGQWLVAGGALSLAAVAFALLASWLGRGLRLGTVDWRQPLPLTAVVLVILFTTLNLAQATLIASPEELAANGPRLGLGELAVQAAAFVLLAVLGVGFGIRRSGRATLDRLGLRPIVLSRDAFTVLTATLGMLAMSILVGGLLSQLAPQSVANASALNQLIIGAVSTPGGAVLLGLLSGIGEEVLYRGALQPAFGLWGASLIFALHHVQYLNYALLVIFLLGLALGLIRNRYGTTVAAAVHASYNTILIFLALAAAGLTPR